MHQLDQVLGKAFQVKEDLCGGSRRWGPLPVGFLGGLHAPEHPPAL